MTIRVEHGEIQRLNEDKTWETFGTVQGVDYLEALDVFAANWPEHMGELDGLRADYVEIFGEPIVERKKRATAGPKREKKRGSGARFRELILLGKSNQECLDIVRKEFPDSKATLSDAAWNRYQLQKNPSGFSTDGSKV